MSSNLQPAYLPGEEEFGFFSPHMYTLARLVPSMRRFHSFVVEDVLSFNFGSVIDIGSGPGFVLERVVQQKMGSWGLGIDPSPHMVKIAKRRASKQGISNRVSYALGSSHALPSDRQFDLAYSSLSFHHWKEREESLRNVIKSLKPGGSFNIYEVASVGGFGNRAAASHLMGKEDLLKVSGSSGIPISSILEKDGFIRASFTKA